MSAILIRSGRRTNQLSADKRAYVRKLLRREFPELCKNYTKLPPSGCVQVITHLMTLPDKPSFTISPDNIKRCFREIVEENETSVSRKEPTLEERLVSLEERLAAIDRIIGHNHGRSHIPQG